MLFFVFGLPCQFALWCERVVTGLLTRAGEAPGLIVADRLAQIAQNAITTEVSHAVVSARQPSRRLRGALVGSGRNFVVALDEPHIALLDLVIGHGIELPAAVQALASSCGALRDIAATPGALMLSAGADWPSDAATVAAIARHLQIPADEASIADVLAEPAIAAVRPSQYDAVAWWNGLAPAEQQLAVGALGPFAAPSDDQEPLSLTWGRQLFFLAESPGRRATGPIDITGRVRGLLHGPDIVLPPGAWSLSLVAEVARGGAEHEFSVEVSAGAVLAAGTLRPQQEGVVSVSFDFVLDANVEQPVTLRIGTTRAAFDGQLTLIAARLVQTAGEPPPTAPA